MTRNMTAACAFFVLVFTAKHAALAFTSDDVVKLARAGLSDDVIISQIAAEKASFKLATDDILALKKAGVGDRVIEFMIRTGDDRAAGTPRVEVTTPALPGGRCPISIANQDDQAYSAMIDETGRSIFFYFGNPNDRVYIGKKSMTDLDVSPGDYSVKWVGERGAFTFRLGAGQRCRIVVSRVDLADVKALNVSVTVDDAQVAGGTLKTFWQAAPAMVTVARAVPQPEIQRTVVVYQPAYPVRQNYSHAYYPTSYHHTTYYPSSYCHTQNRPLISSNMVFWGGVGAAIGHSTHRNGHHQTWQGAAVGVFFGHLLDDLRYKRDP
jgi:hypothetical protein